MRSSSWQLGWILIEDVVKVLSSPVGRYNTWAIREVTGVEVLKPLHIAKAENIVHFQGLCLVHDDEIDFETVGEVRLRTFKPINHDDCAKARWLIAICAMGGA